MDKGLINGEFEKIIKSEHDENFVIRGRKIIGFFENIAERIKAVLTPETRRTILELKYLTPDDEHIMGIEYYQAVIADNVKTYPEFIQWRKAHPVTGIVSWCP